MPRTLEALIAGESDPARLAALAHRRVKAPPERLAEALRGRVTPNHRFLLRLHLRQIDALEAAVGDIDREVEADLEPCRAAVRLLRSIPGVSTLSAEVIAAEIGTDMRRFPTAGPLLSWAGLCPRRDERAGKRRSTRLRQGAPWLKTTLVPCAWAATRQTASSLQAQFRRPRRRRGPKEAVCAVAASIPDRRLPQAPRRHRLSGSRARTLRRRSKTSPANRLVRQLEDLGYTVEITPEQASARAGSFLVAMAAGVVGGGAPAGRPGA